MEATEGEATSGLLLVLLGFGLGVAVGIQWPAIVEKMAASVESSRVSEVLNSRGEFLAATAPGTAGEVPPT